MCGRFTLTSSPEELERAFGALATPHGFGPRYNVAPQQPVLALVAGEDGARRFDLFQWGLVPFWAKDPTIGNRMINARAETVAEKPAFRAAFEKRRCLVVMDGFYEWRPMPGGKVPMRIHVPSRAPFTAAGLWERWGPAGYEPLFTCTILTIQANDFMRPIHDRMPVLLDGEGRDRWLDAAAPRDALVDLLRPYDGELEAYEVDRRVNSPRNDGPECVEPIATSAPPTPPAPPAPRRYPPPCGPR